MRLWICVPGGNDDKERVVYETDDIKKMDAAIKQYWEDEVEHEDEYFMIENQRRQDCFNNPYDWYSAFRGYYEPQTLAAYLGKKLL